MRKILFVVMIAGLASCKKDNGTSCVCKNQLSDSTVQIITNSNTSACGAQQLQWQNVNQYVKCNLE